MALQTPNEQQQYDLHLVSPTDILRSWYGRKGREIGPDVEEYKLREKPASLKHLASIFEARKESHCFVWWTGSCLGRPADCLQYIPSTYRRFQIVLHLDGPDDFEVEFAIVAVTLPQALDCLDSILGLQDDFFTCLRFSGHPSHLFVVGEGEEVPPCQFELRHLRALLRVERRVVEFFLMSFSPEQCNLLGSLGTNLAFDHCVFEDGGRGFVETFMAREDDKPFEQLRLHKRLPFEPQTWLLFVHSLQIPMHPRLRQLSLSWITLEDEGLPGGFDDLVLEASCRSLADANLELLELSDCVLHDRGAALVGAVRNGRGHTGLNAVGTVADPFHVHPFESASMWTALVQALGSHHCRLKHLSIGPFPGIGSESISWKLGNSLLWNKSLEYLDIASNKTELSQLSWNSVLTAVAVHPSIRILSLPRFVDSQSSRATTIEEAKREGTLDVVEMLSTNNVVEKIHVRSSWYDRDLWERKVAPRLELNKYREFFSFLRSTKHQPTRAALLVRALARFGANSSMTNELLRQNQDILASYTGSGKPQCSHGDSARDSRKRSRPDSS